MALVFATLLAPPAGADPDTPERPVSGQVSTLDLLSLADGSGEIDTGMPHDHLLSVSEEVLASWITPNVREVLQRFGSIPKTGVTAIPGASHWAARAVLPGTGPGDPSWLSLEQGPIIARAERIIARTGHLPLFSRPWHGGLAALCDEIIAGGKAARGLFIVDGSVTLNLGRAGAQAHDEHLVGAQTVEWREVFALWPSGSEWHPGLPKEFVPQELTSIEDLPTDAPVGPEVTLIFADSPHKSIRLQELSGETTLEETALVKPWGGRELTRARAKLSKGVHMPNAFHMRQVFTKPAEQHINGKGTGGKILPFKRQKRPWRSKNRS